jgi:RNA recognition motif-containing protein
MTLDDESSVYVGGLAYDSTEDMLQKAFETYGDINSIKVPSFSHLLAASTNSSGPRFLNLGSEESQLQTLHPKNFKHLAIKFSELPLKGNSIGI